MSSDCKLSLWVFDTSNLAVVKTKVFSMCARANETLVGLVACQSDPFWAAVITRECAQVMYWTILYTAGTGGAILMESSCAISRIRSSVFIIKRKLASSYRVHQERTLQELNLFEKTTLYFGPRYRARWSSIHPGSFAINN